MVEETFDLHLVWLVIELGINANTHDSMKVSLLFRYCVFLLQCDSFVKQYTPEIVKLLLDEVGPNAVCAVLRLCTASMTTLRSVKGLCMSEYY